MSASADQNWLLRRIAATRESLRGPEMARAEESPVEEYERLQRERGQTVKEQLSELAIFWLVVQGLTLLALILPQTWPEGPQPTLLKLMPALLWFGSMVLATAMAVLALSHADALRRRLFVSAFIPWGLLVAEASLMMLIMG